jgi:hypothetical protein
LWPLMRAMPPRRCLRTWLEWADSVDCPWNYRSVFADALRRSLAAVPLTQALSPDALAFYTSLPDPAPVWRGCERGRERGLSWTTDRKVAAGFARGMRCRNAVPTLVQAEIPKRHLFGVFVERNESEVAVDPRRLRKLQRIDEANPLLGTN